MRFEGRVAVVTGGTGPLGRALCEAFAAEGATVVATSRRAPGPAAAGIKTEQVELTDEASVLGLAERVGARHGRCDALVCAAGGFAGGTPIAEAPLSLWRDQLDRNATSAFLACRAFLPLMLAGGDGAVVLVASRSAVQPGAGSVPYAVSKAAVVALAQGLAVELRDAGLRANALLPSVIDTPANREAMPGADVSRWVPPERIAGAALWLCSDEAREVSGAAIPIYGRA